MADMRVPNRFVSRVSSADIKKRGIDLIAYKACLS
jgi:hypothetical protein